MKTGPVHLLKIVDPITEVKGDLAIVSAKGADHEHDLEGLAERVARDSKLCKRLLEISFI